MGVATNLQFVIPWDCNAQGQSCDSGGVSATVRAVAGVCLVQVRGTLPNVSAGGTGGGPTKPHTGCDIQIETTVAL